MRKSILMKCISVMLAVCCCINFWNGDNLVYASEAYDIGDLEFVETYSEFDSGVSTCSFVCEKSMYVSLKDPITDEVGVRIEVLLKYEYADNSWVVVNDALLKVQCYNGFSVVVAEQKEFGGWDTEYDYCGRTILVYGPYGRIAMYYIHAGADCFGDTYLSCEFQKMIN